MYQLNWTKKQLADIASELTELVSKRHQSAVGRKTRLQHIILHSAEAGVNSDL
jgi:hypothetical protein